MVQPRGGWVDGQEGELRAHGGRVKEEFDSSDDRVVELPARAVEALAARDDVEYVSPERETAATGHLVATTGGLMQNPFGKGTLDGTGVGIAVMDSGVYNHLSFTSGKSSRVVKSVDFTGENRTDDPYGHGTHVASAAASNGIVTRMQDGWPVDYAGRASGAKIVNLRVLNSEGRGTLSGLLKAVDWVMANRVVYNIRVVNMSLGMPAVDSYRNDPACRAVRRMVDAGIVVVVAAGNNGKNDAGEKVYGQVHAPGNEPSAITVGASNTYGTDVRSDDTVATYSSRGPTRSAWTDVLGTRHYDNLIKPDLVAPGNKIVAAQSTGSKLITQYPQMDPGTNVGFLTNSRLMYMSGTSVAAPVVAGTAALMLQMQPRLTPNMVKMMLMYTAQQLPGFNAFEQGAGQLNVEGAVRLARTLRLSGLVVTLSAPPAPRTTIAGHTFGWSQGLLLDHAWARGPELLTKYQWAYAAGAVLNDGVRELYDTVERNPERMTAGVTVGTGVMVSDGTTLGDGDLFLPTSLLLSDGIMLSDGVMCSDGIMLSDGIAFGDGIMLSDAYAQALRALVGGDETASMF